MKQRVKLAQALVHDPRLLLLDEPTNGLDPAGRDEMLELILRTGKEFGIAAIVASHLLGEIERVCDFLVAIEGGQLLRAAPLGDFTERTGTLAVEVEEGSEALAARLTAAGLAAVVDGRAVLIAMTDERPYDLVRDTVAELGLPLVRIEQRRHRLEDLFRDEVAPVGVRPRSCRHRLRAAARRPDRRHDEPSVRRQPDRLDLRPRLSRLRRPAARPVARDPVAVHVQPPLDVRPRAKHPGQARAAVPERHRDRSRHSRSSPRSSWPPASASRPAS